MLMKDLIVLPLYNAQVGGRMQIFPNLLATLGVSEIFHSWRHRCTSSCGKFRFVPKFTISIHPGGFKWPEPRPVDQLVGRSEPRIITWIYFSLQLY